jgi:hypothetical protein
VRRCQGTFGRLVVNGQVQTRDVIVLRERVVTTRGWQTRDVIVLRERVVTTRGWQTDTDSSWSGSCDSVT